MDNRGENKEIGAAAGSHKRKKRDRKKAGPSEEEKMYNLKGGTLRINHKPF